MESIGLLAGGIAHDFNNILMGILGYASLAMDRMAPDHPAQRMLKTIVASAERATALTRELLAYARGGRHQDCPVKLDEQVAELVNILRTSLPKGVKVTQDFAVDLPYVMADPAQIQQVIMNLCLNAGEAIAMRWQETGQADRRGALTLRTGVGPLLPDEPLTPPLADAERGVPFVFLEVGDDGCGMDDATRSRIFEPFFTTKFAGRGLGLAAVEGIVRNHGGHLRVVSAKGQGTSFTLFLPAVFDVAEVLEAEELLLAGGRETILVIDDEDVVRQLALLTLTNLGYRVLLAEHGGEGLSVLRARKEEVRLVIADLTMPGLHAQALLTELAGISPGTPVLLTSGYDETAALGEAQEQKYAGFLQKPYTPEVLGRAVRRLLDVAVGRRSLGPRLPSPAP